MAERPLESDIKQIFKRLVSVPTNKQCFDCTHSNPTWASVTYGVFLCIDCSAVHRSLGVHVTFIRSTVLDTNWTWLQLRAMQVGGNSNAKAFFNQHGCVTEDAQKKYHSRAASLYRDKVLSLAQHAMRLHGTKLFIEGKGKNAEAGQLHIESHNDPNSPEPKEVDFFSEHAQDNFPATTSITPITDSAKLGGGDSESVPRNASVNGKAADVDPTAGPNVEAALSTSPTQAMMQAEPRKAIIGTKKGPAAKKGKGLGAQRVKKDFSEIESRAQQVDKEREELAKNIAVQEAKTAEEQEKQMANMRLAYQDMSLQRKKEEEKLRNDPKKAEQFERLGMGFAGNKGISHSAISDMQTIQQDSPSSGSSGRRDFDSYGEKPKSRRDFFDDEFEFVSSWSSSKRGGDSSYGNDHSGWGNKNRSGGWDFDQFEDKSSLDSRTPPVKQDDRKSKRDGRKGSSTHDPHNYVELNENGGEEDDMEEDVENEMEPSRSRKAGDSHSSETSDAAQKKFGNAKSISSDMYFGNSRDNDFEHRQNLARLEGSTSISSDDYFGRNSGRRAPSYGSNAPDLQEIKDGVKQGVTKVAGKISSLANGVMSSLQDRYG